MAAPVGTLRIDLTAGIATFEKDLARAGKVIQREGRQWQNIGRGLTQSVSLPLVGMGTAAVVNFAKFDDAMTQSLAIMGNVSGEMRRKMEATAKDVAKSTTFSASEAAKAYYYLASAGLSAAQSVEALPQVAKFAQAGMFDMARATELGADATQALGLEMSEMPKVLDALVKGASLANASVEQLSTSLTRKAATAIKTAGQSMNEGIALLSAFASAGVKGEQAGNALTVVFRELQNKAMDNAKAFKAFGLEVFDAGGKMRPVSDIIADLETKFRELSPAERLAQLKLLGFSQESLVFVQSVIGMSEKIKAFKADLDNAGGTVDQVAAKQLTGFSAQIKLLVNQLSVALLPLGAAVAEMLRALLPVVSMAAEAIGVLANAFGDLPQWMQTTVVGIGALAAAIGPTVWLIGSMRVALGTLFATVKLLGPYLPTITTGLLNLSKAFVAVRGSALLALSPISKLGIAFGVFASLIYLADQHIAGFHQKLITLQRNAVRIADLIVLKAIQVSHNRAALAGMLDLWAEKERRYSDAMRGTSEVTKQAAAPTEEMRKTLAELQAALDDATRDAGGFDKALADLAAGADDNAKRIREMREEFDKFRTSTLQQIEVDAVAKGIEAATTDSEFLQALDHYGEALREQTIASIKESYGEAITDQDAAELADKIVSPQLEQRTEDWAKGLEDKAKAAHEEHVSFFSGLMEDAITGTRFSWEDQMKKAAVQIVSHFLAYWIEGMTVAQAALSSLQITVGTALGPLGQSLGLGVAATGAAAGTALGGGGAAAGGLGAGAGLGANIGASAGGAGLTWLGAAGYGGGALVGYQQYRGIENLLHGQQIGLSQQAGLAMMTGGLSFLANPIMEALGGGQSWQEEVREDLRDLLREQGVTDEDDRFRLMTGGYANLGTAHYQGNNLAEGTYTKLADESRGMAESFSLLMTGGEKGYASDALTNMLANAVAGFGELSNEATSMNGVIANLLGLLDQMGITAEEGSAKMTQLFLDGKISTEQWGQSLQTFNQLAQENLIGTGSVNDALDIVASNLGPDGNPRAALKGLELAFKEAAELGEDQLAILTDYITQRFGPEAAKTFDEKVRQAGVSSFEDFAELSDNQLFALFESIQQWGDDTAVVQEAVGEGWWENENAVQAYADAIEAIPESKTTTIERHVYTFEHDGHSTGVHGGARGAVIGLARGGVVHGPQIFSALGRRIMVGEAGAEAILPLARTSRGLGVHARVEGGAGQMVNVYNINAAGAAAGVENRIYQAIRAAEDRSVRRSMRSMARL